MFLSMSISHCLLSLSISSVNLIMLYISFYVNLTLPFVSLHFKCQPNHALYFFPCQSHIAFCLSISSVNLIMLYVSFHVNLTLPFVSLHFKLRLLYVSPRQCHIAWCFLCGNCTLLSLCFH